MLGLAIGACGLGEVAPEPAPVASPVGIAPPSVAPPPVAVAPVAPPAPPPGLAAPPSFGVPECDHYAQVACNCSSPTVRGPICSGLTQQFATWDRVLRGGASRGAIVEACRNLEASLLSGQCAGTVVAPVAAAPAQAPAAPAAAGAEPARPRARSSIFDTCLCCMQGPDCPGQESACARCDRNPACRDCADEYVNGSADVEACR